MVGGAPLRPRPPSPDEIIQDIISATSSDPVFIRLSDATDLRRLTGSTIKDVTESTDNQLSDIDVSYRKVRVLLDNLSSLQAGKDRLNQVTEELLYCKEDVSAMSLELKTRLEMHKIASTRGNH